jgi:hypothetical protein
MNKIPFYDILEYEIRYYHVYFMKK